MSACRTRSSTLVHPKSLIESIQIASSVGIHRKKLIKALVFKKGAGLGFTEAVKSSLKHQKESEGFGPMQTWQFPVLMCTTLHVPWRDLREIPKQGDPGFFFFWCSSQMQKLMSTGVYNMRKRIEADPTVGFFLSAQSPWDFGILFLAFCVCGFQPLL